MAQTYLGDAVSWQVQRARVVHVSGAVLRVSFPRCAETRLSSPEKGAQIEFCVL